MSIVAFTKNPMEQCFSQLRDLVLPEVVMLLKLSEISSTSLPGLFLQSLLQAVARAAAAAGVGALGQRLPHHRLDGLLATL